MKPFLSSSEGQRRILAALAKRSRRACKPGASAYAKGNCGKYIKL